MGTLKLPPSAETLNRETPNPSLWNFWLTQQLPAGAEWAGMCGMGWGLTRFCKWLSSWPKPYWVAKRNVVGLGHIFSTWTESKGVASEAECSEVNTRWESVQLTLAAHGGSEL